MRLEGYHNTEASKAKKILQEGFRPERNNKHWLGQGIYFFADVDTAFDNIDMLCHSEEVKTIAVEIEVENSAFLDLDIRENLNSFRKYFNKKAALLKAEGKELVLKESNHREVMLIYKCYFLDLFKWENGYKVVSKTFPKDQPPYAEPVPGIKYLGLPFLEKYICVSGNEYIVKKNLVEKEWIV